MHITIVGAGAMGTLFAGLLAESGSSVTLVGRSPAHLDAIRAQGLLLDTDAGERRVALAVARADELKAPAEVLMVWTKARDTAAALHGMRHLIGEQTWLVSLQNGLGNAATLEQFAPRSRIVVGVSTCPADLAGPGHVRSHGASRTRLYSADGAERPIVSQLVDALARAGLAVEADPQVEVAIWEKAAFNCALNSIGAVTTCTNGGLTAHPDGPQLALDLAAEVVAVARARGVAADAARVQQTILGALAAHPKHRGSMLQDVLAGRPTEIESLNGAVVAEADRLGMAVPLTRTLATLVRLVEARVTGKTGS